MVQEGEDMGSDLGGEELDEIYRKQWLAMSRQTEGQHPENS